MSIEIGGGVTLDFDDGAGTFAAKYFGFSWNAGDGENQITVQSGGSDVFTFKTQDIINILPNDASTVTAIGSSTYDTANYYGKPGTGALFADRDNNDEPILISISSRQTVTHLIAFCWSTLLAVSFKMTITQFD